jgi:hypothetical protein
MTIAKLLLEAHQFPARRPAGLKRQPSEAGRDAAGRTSDAAGIEDQDGAHSFIARLVRMPVDNDVDVLHWHSWRNVHQPNPQTRFAQVDDKGPVINQVAIAANDANRRAQVCEPVEHALGAHVSKMPDGVAAHDQAWQFRRDPVVGVGDYRNAHRKTHRSKPENRDKTFSVFVWLVELRTS